LAQVLEAPELLADERFRDNASRMANLGALVELIALRFKRRPSSEWLAALAAVGVPAGPVLTIAEMLEHPQVLARDMVVETMHPKAGKVRAIGCPLKLSVTPAHVSRAAPLFGQHTREVLEQVGLTGAEIDGLIRTRAAIQSPVGAD
jgi:crotonobetainyl-CoA:carnitine CoA-transferase CaiB-like acyl-CoA transferase